jgi:NADP-dependent 3-hydroxy acid dehydrogenase YdfG
MDKAAIVTGAGSGVGRAVAVRLIADDWSVGLIGRTAQALEETRRLSSNADRAIVTPCDVVDAGAVETAFNGLIAQFGGVHALVNSAGTNIPVRALDSLSMDDYRHLIDVNLNGAFYCVQAVLPTMRAQRRGTIVNVISDAGLLANAKAGPAYVASKFGLAGLTQSINAEERGRGIRGCAIFPGDINTPLLDKRPSPPSPEARLTMLQPDDVADCVMLAIGLPERAVVEQLVIRPR